MINKVNGFSLNSNQNRQNVSFGRCRFFRATLDSPMELTARAVINPADELRYLKGLLLLIQKGFVKPSRSTNLLEIQAGKTAFCLQKFPSTNIIAIHHPTNKGDRIGILISKAPNDSHRMQRAFDLLINALDELRQPSKILPPTKKPGLFSSLGKFLKLPGSGSRSVKTAA